jgi:hypothetical protein
LRGRYDVVDDVLRCPAAHVSSNDVTMLRVDLLELPHLTLSMSRPRPALQIALLAACAGAAVMATTGAAASTRHCTPRSIGPGSLLRGGTTGAKCMLAAFQGGCRSADYVLASYGVDTARSETFRTERLAGDRCGVVVVTTFRVVPQPPRVTDRRTCVRIRKTSRDIVADRCATPATISLTKLG